MAEPKNSEILAEVTALRQEMKSLIANLPALAKLSEDSDLRREREEFERNRAESIAKRIAGFKSSNKK